METAKNKCYSRYSCVNLLNYSTIEFRMFRGTLRCSTLKATLQLVNEICDVAFSSSDEEMRDLTSVEFVARLGGQRYPELVNYLKERRLYVCEPVQGGRSKCRDGTFTLRFSKNSECHLSNESGMVYNGRGVETTPRRRNKGGKLSFSERDRAKKSETT